MYSNKGYIEILIKLSNEKEKKDMETKFDYANDVGKQHARMMMANRHQNLSIAEKEARNSYFNTFHMYCENNVIERFRRLQEKLASKNLMFKFDGSKYAIFPLDMEDRTPLTDYRLTLEEAEDFAEKV